MGRGLTETSVRGPADICTRASEEVKDTWVMRGDLEPERALAAKVVVEAGIVSRGDIS